MQLCSTLFVALIALLATSETFATATDSKGSALVSHDIPTSVNIEPSNKRFLRTTKTIDDDDSDSTNSINTEERKIEMPAALKNLGIKAKRRYWLEFDKSDDYIKEKLGLTGLTGKQLTEHTNYKHFRWIQFRKEGDMLHDWLAQVPPLPTFDAWKKLGLEDMVLKRVQLDVIKQTDKYATYERYVKGFDKFIIREWSRWSPDPHVPKNQIPRSATETEMMAKADIWGRTTMSDEYVLYALGLDKLKRAELVKNDDYKKYFLLFKDVKEKMEMKKKASA
ncbi:hypothetical protein PHYBOEH_006111 [Phytophthora boehmeriae]|uniref:RxLR effector protein n=1 Tax=Phytophthora boehmeriae TaxID=109152 RepID=A0A8T1X4W4_9STRA|nr:hypothetical protein PHYBOEH_006111 [Phytophthora boehmeriae]